MVSRGGWVKGIGEHLVLFSGPSQDCLFQYGTLLTQILEVYITSAIPHS